MACIQSFARAKPSNRLFHNGNFTLLPSLGTAVLMLLIPRDPTARLLPPAISTSSPTVYSRLSVLTPLYDFAENPACSLVCPLVPPGRQGLLLVVHEKSTPIVCYKLSAMTLRLQGLAVWPWDHLRSGASKLLFLSLGVVYSFRCGRDGLRVLL